MKKEFRSFKAAREFVHNLEIKNQRDWTTYCKSEKQPHDIPSRPDKIYKNKGWVNYGDWLGTGMIRHRDRKYWEYAKARDYVQKLEIKNTTIWRQYVKSGKLPKQIPADPMNVYKNKGWVSTGDWLGTDSVASFLRDYWSFEKARDYVHNLKMKSQSDWTLLVKSGKLPKQIPSTPSGVYKNNGWKSWGDWLGTGILQTQMRQYREFNDAREFVHSQNLKSTQDWRKFANSNKKPDDIPWSPYKVYKNKGWKGMGDWLGTGTISSIEKSKNYLSWSEAKKEYRRLHHEYNLNNQIQWTRFASKHKKLLEKLHLPESPWLVYTKERVWERMQK